MAEWPRRSGLIKVTYSWSLPPHVDRKKFEDWYLDQHVADTIQKYSGPKLVKYVVNRALSDSIPNGPASVIHRMAELFFPSLDDLPERFKRVPPYSDVLEYGAVGLLRTYWHSEEVILKP